MRKKITRIRPSNIQSLEELSNDDDDDANDDTEDGDDGEEKEGEKDIDIPPLHVSGLTL